MNENFTKTKTEINISNNTPLSEKHFFHNAIERIKKQGFVKDNGQTDFEKFLHNKKEKE